MTLNEYQQRAMTTCMASSENFSYMFLNLVGEVGEAASKVAKAIRKGYCRVENNKLVWSDDCPEDTDALFAEIQKECGDILWQLSGLCNVMGFTLEETAQQNIDKLASRKSRGVIDGSGDNR